MPQYDAILVPGGGVRENGQLPPWVELRLEKALEMADGVPIITLSAGTTHKPPPLEPNGWPLLEAVAMARFLMRRGYPPKLLWTEAGSYDTIGNAFFTRQLHTEPAGLRSLLVVTSSFHLQRTQAIFRWVFGLDEVHGPYRLHFVDTPDTGMAPEVLEARRAKERTRMATLAQLVSEHRSLASLHAWLVTEHSAYAIATTSLKETARDKLLDSY
jgi:uncharacterized SAM-binding protein YcdF (DUF218 family)